MKKLILTLFSFFLVLGLSAQNYPIRADTLVVMKPGGNANIRLENSTKSVKGVVTNVDGKGTMGFIKSRIIGDSLLVVGLDTLKLPNSGSTSVNAVTTIAALKQYGGSGVQIVDVGGYYAVGDGGGGRFYWSDTSTMTDNGGTIIKVINVTTGRWKRIVPTAEVNVKWFGAKGDGVSNDTDPCQRAIDAYASNSQASVYFTKGTYLVANLKVKTGITLKADQKAKDNYIAAVPVTIKAFGTPSFIVEVDTLSTNWGIYNLYIEGDFANQPQLIAGVRLRGQKGDFIGNQVNACAQFGVYSDAGLINVKDNGIFGWYGAAPTFSSTNDFRGALHFPALGDSWVEDNEVGAGLNYFTSTVTPRDPVNGRICAMYLGSVFGGTSKFSGNLFENGDRCVVIGNSLYASFSHNRYELSAMGGLYFIGPAQYLSFMGERFSDNSLTADATYNDIDIAVGAAGHISFIGCIHERLYNGAIPNSIHKVKWLISNYGSTEIEWVTPNVDTSYYSAGIVNDVDVQALPIRQVVGQYDPDNVKFTSVSTEKLPADTPAVGYVKLTRGTGAANQALTGGVQFYKYDNTPVALLGFNASPDMWFTLNQANGSYNFLNGGINSYKNGGSVLSLNSLNGAGSNIFYWKSDLLATHVSSISMNNLTGEMRWLADTSITIGATGNGNIRFNLNGYTTLPFKPAKAIIGSADVLTRDTVTGDIKYNSISEILTGAGGIQLVNITKAALAGLRATATLDTTKLYRVTDATTQNIPVFIRATSNSILDKHVTVTGYDYSDAVYDPVQDTIILTDRIFGVIRCTAGTWSFISGFHDKEGVDSVTIDVLALNRLKVYFTKRGYYSGVGNIMADADNNYPFYNIVSGTSVALDYFYIDMYQSMNVQDSVYWSSGTTFLKKTTAVTSLSWNAGTSTLTVNHSPFIMITNWPIISSLGQYFPKVTSITNTAFTVQFFDMFGNLVTTLDSNCKFNFSRTSNNQIITDYATYASQGSTNLWIQGWMHKLVN